MIMMIMMIMTIVLSLIIDYVVVVNIVIDN